MELKDILLNSLDFHKFEFRCDANDLFLNIPIRKEKTAYKCSG